jgi:hypothetical protein
LGGSRGIFGITKSLEGFCVKIQGHMCNLGEVQGQNANLKSLGLICKYFSKIRGLIERI